MYFSIRKKLIFTYILLILIPLVLVNYWAVDNMKGSVLGEVEVNSLKTANIIANLSRDRFTDVPYLKRIIRQYVPSLDGRMLILNPDTRVLADSHNLLEGNNINNIEITNALEGREKLGYYQINETILQVAVPIARVVDGNRQVIGVVLISTSVEDPLQQVEDFRRQLTYISLMAALIGLVVAVLAARGMTEPILLLSKAAKRIGEGHLGETVKITSRDEIGKLADNFNHMSKQLDRIERGRTQFIGDVSHELKTPLASMKALIDSLLYGEEDIEVFKEYLRDMDSEIDRLTQLIKSLLKLAKIEEQGIDLEENNLKVLTEDVLKILNPLIEQGEVTVSTELKGAPSVLCDGEMIKEVLINLIDNAIKYKDTTKETNQVWIKGSVEKSHYVLAIKDNGIGIGEEDLKSIFEKFYRADLSRSRDTGGAGIGLSLVDRILRLHGWRLEVDSLRGEGTTFLIRIPKSSFNHPS
ncbi:sensor histidine kinase [Alkaliphilus transvaalensis]|uniref:sensor histidine kinase n=1 Tax=Alkaliphilus transvaalensis TaxID=114628 RepID=UPI00047A6A55|nr:HAMP domain-containing sensor histidine kinase [Alkaliphilus transvaalensis]